MKRHRIILAVLFIIQAINVRAQIPPPSEITFTPVSSYEFTSGGGTSIQIEAEQDGRAVRGPVISENVSWLTISVVNDLNDNKFTITCSPYTGQIPRTAEVTVTKNADVGVFTVTQLGVPGPDVPPNPTVSAMCDGAVLTRSDPPPSGVTYYWQTTSTGTSTSNSAITWTVSSESTFYLRAEENGLWSAAASVTVTFSGVPARPPAPTETVGCGSIILTRAEPPAGVTYFWQTSPTGTSIANSSLTYEAQTVGSYYLRARDNCGNWSSNRSIMVSDVIPGPPILANNKLNQTQNCGNTVLHNYESTLMLEPGRYVIYYWQTSDDGTDTGNPSTSDWTITSGGQYYIRGKVDDEDCWGPALEINVVVYQIPAAPGNPTLGTYGCGIAELQHSTNNTSNTWYWQTSANGTVASSNTGSPYTVSVAGNHYLRARSPEGCWSPETDVRSVNAVLGEVPGIPLAPTNVDQQCGVTEVTLATPANANEVYYWQDNTTDKIAADSETPKAFYADQTKYLRAKNTVTGCWSDYRTINIDVIELPATPQAHTTSNQVCGSTQLDLFEIDFDDLYDYGPGSGQLVTTWYWQTTIDDTSTSIHYYNTQLWDESFEQDIESVPDPNIQGLYHERLVAPTYYDVDQDKSYFVRAKDPNGCWSASQTVTVSVDEIPAIPDMPIISANPCGERTIKMTADMFGNDWYWQTDSYDESTQYPLSSPDLWTSTVTGSIDTSLYFHLNGSGQAYLKAKAFDSDCWSASIGVGVTYLAIPAKPPHHDFTYQCDYSELDLYLGNVGPDGLIQPYYNDFDEEWYWQTHEDSTSTDNPYYETQLWDEDYTPWTVQIPDPDRPGDMIWVATLPTQYDVDSDKTYYLRSLSREGCWSDTTIVTVDVKPRPVITQGFNIDADICDQVTLSHTNDEPFVDYYWHTIESDWTNKAPSIDIYTTQSVSLRGKRTDVDEFNCWGDVHYENIDVTNTPVITFTDLGIIEPGFEVDLVASNAETYDWISHDYVDRINQNVATIIAYEDFTVSARGTNYGDGFECIGNYYDYNVDVELIELESALSQTSDQLSISADHGARPYTYRWSTGEKTPTIDLSGESVYAVTITDFYDATDIKTAIINGTSSYTGSDNNIKNSTRTRVYNETGGVVGESKSYSDYFGKGIQSQSRNITDNKAIVVQTVYDAFGRAVVSTLPAAINNPSLDYKKGFITNETGQDYSYTNFDRNKLNDPDPVNSGIENTLGWYYSGLNPEAYVPASKYPYTRVEYSKITGQARRSAIAGEHHKMGSNHETYSFTMPASDDELNGFATDLGANFEYQGLIKSVSVDAEKKQAIVYTNKEGNTIATCLTGTDAGTQITDIIPEYCDFKDIHIPEGCGNTLQLPSGYDYVIYDLMEKKIPVESSGGAVNLAAGFYRIATDTDVDLDFQYNINYHHFAFNVYDKAGRLIESYSPKAVAESRYDWKTTYTYNILGWLMKAISPEQGTTQYVYRKDGSIRFSQNAQQADDGTFSYTNYDESGRVIEVGECIEDASLVFDPGMSATIILDDYSNARQSVTYTKYDVADNSIQDEGFDQKFLHGAVSRTWTDSDTTWYSYKYDGKVEWILQSINGLGWVTVDYEYNFNGNATKVIYMKDATNGERFEHRYVYDADLRLSEVYTRGYDGSAAQSEKLQAKYFYYPHGALKRVEIADNLQGIDYVYNINGWLKSINHPSLGIDDPGKDGLSPERPNQDLFGMTLDYYSGDYTRGNTFITNASQNNLYDGNITAQRWNRKEKGTEDVNQLFTNQWMYGYQYNNLNYLTDANFGTYNMNTLNSVLDDSLSVNDLTYDANGNLLTLNRTAYGNELMDQFGYAYDNGKPNQLSTLTDEAIDYGYNDLENGEHTFIYDKLGQMTQRTNADGTVEHYEYNVYGKVFEIYVNDTLKVKYDYDDKGFRIRKLAFDDDDNFIETWYVRDASGNILSVYTSNDGVTIEHAEIPIYGSGRIGVNYVQDSKYEYELADHLGNVRATFSESGDKLSLNSYADYFPFGMKIPGRMGTAGKYRFGYQGQFAEDETEETGYNAFEARLWDSRIGRWTSYDPAFEFYSPYLGMGNNPIRSIDPDGRDITDIIYPDGSVKHIDDGSNAVFRAWGSGFLMFMGYSDKYGYGKEGNYIDELTYSAQSRIWKNSDYVINFMANYELNLKLEQYAKMSGAIEPCYIEQDIIEIGMTLGTYGAYTLAKYGTKKLAHKAGTNLVDNVAIKAKRWLGNDYKAITNKAGDNIFMSDDGLRKIRFDILNPHGDIPHVHFEILENGKWKDAIPGTHRIYPKSD